MSRSYLSMLTKTAMANQMVLQSHMVKCAVAVKGFNYTKDGKYPDNILNFSSEKQEEVLKSLRRDGFTRGKDYIKTRKMVERSLRTVASEKIPKEHMTGNAPLYFRVGKDPDGWKGGYTEYEIDKSLLQKATYSIGDSFNHLATFKSRRNTAALTDILRKNMLTHDELKKTSIKKVDDILSASLRKGGDYVEGQIWSPYKVVGNKIVEDKK